MSFLSDMERCEALKRFSSELNKCDFKQKRSDERRDGMRKEEREGVRVCEGVRGRQTSSEWKKRRSFAERKSSSLSHACVGECMLRGTQVLGERVCACLL